MQQYFETLTDDSGNALYQAKVTVAVYPAGGTAAIYSTNGTGSPIAGQTVITDVTGQLSFYAPDGAYILTYSYNGTVYKTKSPVQILDPMALVPIADTGSANAYVITDQRLPTNLIVGTKVLLQATHNNTGAATFNMNSTGAQPVTTSSLTTLGANLLVNGGYYLLIWDGTEWQVSSASASAFTNLVASSSSATPAISASSSAATGSNNGVLIQAGTNGSDYGLKVQNSAASITGLQVLGTGVTQIYDTLDGINAVKNAAGIDSGTFVGTLTGCTTAPTATFNWTRVGGLVSIDCNAGVTATSNATTMTITGVPAALVSARGTNNTCLVENSGANVIGWANMGTSGQITFNMIGNFTNTGTKGVPGNTAFVYSIV